MKSLVIIGEYDYSGIGYHLAEAVNEFIEDWKAISIVDNTHPFKFPTHLIATKDNIDLVNEKINNADFILHGSSSYYYYPTKKSFSRETPRGLWHGGTFYRHNFQQSNARIHQFFDIVFAHRDLVSLGKNVFRLDAPFPVHKYSVDNDFSDKILIGHNPSRQHIKGTKQFENAMKRLSSEYNIEWTVIDNCLYQESVYAKRYLHIFFDQIGDYFIPEGRKVRGYGTALIEAAAMGAVCLGDSNYDDTPIIQVYGENSIIRVIERLLDDRKEMARISEETTEWVLKTHGYEAIANYFIETISPIVERNKEVLRIHYRKLGVLK